MRNGPLTPVVKSYDDGETSRTGQHHLLQELKHLVRSSQDAHSPRPQKRLLIQDQTKKHYLTYQLPIKQALYTQVLLRQRV